MERFLVARLALIGCVLTAGTLLAQEPEALPGLAEMIVLQDPPQTVPRVLEMATPDNTRIVVSLGRQRAYLYVDGEVAIDAPVSTGKSRGRTPTGDFTITDKTARHRTQLHGDFIDGEGSVVRSGVSARIDAAPSGTAFRPLETRYYMRLSPDGLALHAGRLPGYPATDMAVRLPSDIAPLFFQRVKQGTVVRIED
jgi:lipoprotein-anchoring transpeptidase ErfK/SrfK